MLFINKIIVFDKVFGFKYEQRNTDFYYFISTVSFNFSLNTSVVTVKGWLKIQIFTTHISSNPLCKNVTRSFYIFKPLLQSGLKMQSELKCYSYSS